MYNLPSFLELRSRLHKLDLATEGRFRNEEVRKSGECPGSNEAEINETLTHQATGTRE